MICFVFVFAFAKAKTQLVTAECSLCHTHPTARAEGSRKMQAGLTRGNGEVLSKLDLDRLASGCRKWAR